jgi:uroporphyrinogen-III synthase
VSTKNISAELLQRMELAGIHVFQKDFIQKTISLPENLESNSIHSTIVLTSKIGVQAWMEIVEKYRIDKNQHAVYCIELGTKTLADQYGLSIVGVAKDASSLVDEILKNKSIRKVSFVCSNLRRDELPDTLRMNGIQVDEIKAYTTELIPVEIQENVDGVLFFSPSAIDSFLMLNNNTTCIAFCIGNTTANYAENAGFSKAQVADISTPESLVEKVIHFYKNQTIHA